MSPSAGEKKPPHRDPDDRVLAVLAEQTRDISEIKGGTEAIKVQVRHLTDLLDDIGQIIHGGGDSQRGIVVKVDRLEEYMRREMDEAKQARAEANLRIEKNSHSAKSAEDTAKTAEGTARSAGESASAAGGKASTAFWTAIAGIITTLLVTVGTIVVAYLTRGGK